MKASSRAYGYALVGVALLWPRPAEAQVDPGAALVPAPAVTATAAPPVAPPPPPAATAANPSPAPAPAPAPATAPTTRFGPPPLELGQHFTIDPVADGVLIAGGAGFSILLSLVLSTGEIKPTPPTPTTTNLLPIDRLAVTQTLDPHAALYSDIMLGTSIGFAVLDPVLSGLRDGWDALEVDAVMYAETISLTETITDITKIAVRRPRPIDYINCAKSLAANGCSNNTDYDLSFFSGHAATVGAIGATATYLAFIRDPHRVRPWITLVASTALTTLVSYERVRSGEHFPTDVIAGSLAGAAVGVLVPHLHRHAQEAPRVVLGAAPVPGGSELTLRGVF